MPRMDGWRLASEINSDKTINDAKLFLIVPEGQLRQDAKMRMLNWFNGYIHKPVKTENLFKLLSDAFSDPIELKSEEPVIDEAAIKVSGEQIAKGVLVLVAEDHPVNRKLIVAFLKKMGAKILEADDGLKAAFAAYGEVTSARVVTDRMTGRSKGFGFVEMPDAEQAAAAIAALNGKDLDGRPIRVNESQPKPREERRGGRGGFGGRGGYGGRDRGPRDTRW